MKFFSFRRKTDAEKYQRALRIFASVTRFLYCAIVIAGLIWVSISYAIAVYAALAYQQFEYLSELSREVIVSILTVAGLKTIENIFEHNNGLIFGTSIQPPEEKETHDERTDSDND